LRTPNSRSSISSNFSPAQQILRARHRLAYKENARVNNINTLYDLQVFYLKYLVNINHINKINILFKKKQQRIDYLKKFDAASYGPLHEQAWVKK
jgi:hypothetical protein